MSDYLDNISILSHEQGITFAHLFKWLKKHEDFDQGSLHGNVDLKLTANQERKMSLKENSEI